jgi:hypothetical protein
VRRILALAAFQIAAILSWASYHEYVWATAPTFRIPLRPRDPFDVVRGRYFVLNPQDGVIDLRGKSPESRSRVRLVGAPSSYNGKVDVGFCPVGDVYRVCALARKGDARAAEARFWCAGRVRYWSYQDKERLEIDLGLRRFFIPNRLRLPAAENQEGWQLEVSYRPGQSALPRRLFLKGTPIDIR